MASTVGAENHKTDHTDAGAQSTTPPWPAPGHLGSRPALELVTSIAAPLLAGFSLTLCAAVVTDAQQLRWPGPTLIAGVSAVILLITAVQLGAWARQHNVTPADFQTWFEDTDSERNYYLGELGRENKSYRRYARLARATYGIGVVMLLAALAIAVAPPPEADQDTARMIAAAMAALAAASETCWVAYSYRKTRPGATSSP